MQTGRSTSAGAPRRGSSLSPRRQLRVALVLAFVGMAIIPILVVMAATLNLVRAQTSAQIINQLESVVELKQDQITRWVVDSSEDLVLIHNGLDQSRLSGLLVDAADPESQRAISAGLQTFTTSTTDGSGSEHFEALFIYDPQGRVLAASDPILVGRIVARQAYFQPSLAGPHVQSPFYAIGTGELTMMVTLPIAAADGAFRGVLAGQLNLDRLGQIMVVRTGLPSTGETYLVSQENNYLLTPSRVADYPQNRAYRSQGIDRALSGQSGAGLYENYFDPPLPVIGAYRWIPELNAALLAEVDQAEVGRQYRSTIQIGGAITFALSLVAALLGLYIATRVAAPISTLTDAATRIAQGDLQSRVTIQSRNEIGRLADTFNGMADQLQQNLSSLEQRVAERTAELEQANAAQEQILRELRESLQARELLVATVRDLSSPVLPVQPGVLVMPLIGVIDAERADRMTAALLSAIERHQARLVLIDVTGVSMIDTQVAQVLIRAADASRLLGAQPMLVGIRPELAQTIVGLGLDLSNLKTSADLQSGISYAMGRAAR